MVVANRLPVDLERLPDGSTTWKRSPGGLVTALEPVLRRRRGAWVGWPGVNDDGAEPDLHVLDGPIIQDELELHPVRLSTTDIAQYYEGFSNATLWPLYHDVIVKPLYHREWWDRYVDVNQRFAEAASRAAAHGATVWVQDYQLQLVPKMLRMLRPDLTIGFFLHIPFPPVELFMQMPWRTEIIQGLLGADLVGFHLPGGAQNFLILSRRLVGTDTSAEPSVCGRGSVRRCSGPAPYELAPFLSRLTPARSTTLPATATSGAGPARFAPNWEIRARSCSVLTGSTTPRASTYG